MVWHVLRGRCEPVSEDYSDDNADPDGVQNCKEIDSALQLLPHLDMMTRRRRREEEEGEEGNRKAQATERTT